MTSLPSESLSDVLHPVVRRPESGQGCRGFIQHVSAKSLPCWIISDGWPAWLGVVEAAGFDCREIVLTAPQAPWLPAARELLPDIQWSTLSMTTLRRIQRHRELGKGQLFFQGEPTTLSSVFRHLPMDLPWIACFEPSTAVTHPAFTSGCFFNINNLHYGGVVEGTWMCWVSAVLWSDASLPLPPPTYARRLRHVIAPTTAKPRGTACTIPLDDDIERQGVWYVDGQVKVLDWNGALPHKRPLTKVRCPTVFSSTHWLARGLSPLELAKAYDVPSSLHSMFVDWDVQHRKSLPFLSVAPQKVLSTAWAAVAGGGCRCASTPTSGNGQRVKFASIRGG